MAPTAHLAPIGLWPRNLIAPIRKNAGEGDREPVSDRLTKPGLLFHVMGQVRHRVALRHSADVADLFVPACKRHWLEGEECNSVRVIQGKFDNASHLFVVNSIDDCCDRDDVHARSAQVLHSSQLYIKQIPNMTMGVGRVPNAVELQIRGGQTSRGGLLAKLGAFGKLNAVGGCLHSLIANLAGGPPSLPT